MAKVVIERRQSSEYEALGFFPEAASAREVLGEQAWMQMPNEVREHLIVMYMDDAKFVLGSLPTAFVLDVAMCNYMASASATKVDVQERGKYDCIVADSAGARQVSTPDVKDTAREAVLPHRYEIIGAIRDHRAAADYLEEFLRRHECL